MDIKDVIVEQNLMEFAQFVSIEDKGDGCVHYMHSDRPIVVLHNWAANNKASVNLYTPVESLKAELPFAKAESPVEPHKHDSFTLAMVLDGELGCSIGNHSFNCGAGHCFLLNRNIDFSDKYFENSNVAFLHCKKEVIETLIMAKGLIKGDSASTPEILGDFLRADTDNPKQKIYYDFMPISGDSARLLGSYLNNLTESMSAQGKNVFDILSQIYELFDFLWNTEYYVSANILTKLTQQEFLFQKIRQLAVSYNGLITRKELERLLNYNGEYLNTIVKKCTGMSITKYCRDYTLSVFAQRLVNSEDDIDFILDELGITNKNHFYKSFKEKYEMTPSKYRKSIQN